MSQSEEIAGLHHQLKGTEAKLELIDAAQKLTVVPSFKKLILEHYFESEAARMVHLLADPATTDKLRDDLQRSMLGLSEFRNWFLNMCRDRDRTAEIIKDIKQQLEAIASEED